MGKEVFSCHGDLVVRTYLVLEALFDGNLAWPPDFSQPFLIDDIISRENESGAQPIPFLCSVGDQFVHSVQFSPDPIPPSTDEWRMET